MLTSWVLQFPNHRLRRYMLALHILSSSTHANAVMFQASDSDNMFDDNVTTPSANTITSLHNELECYLSTKPDSSMKDVFAWWRAHHEMYPHLYWMAMNYHTIPGELILMTSKFITNLFVKRHL